MDGCSQLQWEHEHAEFPIKLSEEKTKTMRLACGWKVENYDSEKKLDPTLNAPE